MGSLTGGGLHKDIFWSDDFALDAEAADFSWALTTSRSRLRSMFREVGVRIAGIGTELAETY